jgi:hypothetical protein
MAHLTHNLGECERLMNTGLTWLMTDGLDALRNYALFTPLLLIAFVVLVPVLFFVLGRAGERSRPAGPDRTSLMGLRGSITAFNGRTTAQQSTDLPAAILSDRRR